MIYAARIEDIKGSTIYQNMEQILPDEIISHIRLLSNEGPRTERACAYLLLAKALKKEGIEIRDLTFELKENRKPRIVNEDMPDFNLSHSGEYVVCMISEEPCGCDVEMISRKMTSIVRRYYTEEEKKAVIKCRDGNETEPNQALAMSIWTMKESFIKPIGLGLSVPLESFCSIERLPKIRQNIAEGDYYVKTFAINDEYVCAFCQKNKEIEWELCYPE
mgnify:CR=1 FL=1